MPDPAQTPPAKTRARLAVVSLAALGVVYGDIGTSPLYALRECFHGEYGIEPSSSNVLGVLSLMLWALIAVVGVKYLGFVLRADNHGEGGVIALTALVRPRDPAAATGRLALVASGLFAASLLYGDGMITPAISVLSAVEGLEAIAPGLEPWVLPVTVAILAGLFLFQRHGTARIGAVFGPVMLVWFAVLGVLGARSLATDPSVLRAVLPWHGLRFLAETGVPGFLVLGAVFLVVTGAEALYADLGHFGRRPIRLAWFAVAFPCLLLNYFGQGALLLAHPEDPQPFYGLAPAWFLVPLVVLATVATIIASQAVISGAFSLTRQAIQLGYCPRMRIVHTSSEEIGQIYVPRINWILMAATIGLVLGFRSSGRLAAAYGVAVTTTMLITTVVFYTVCTARWGWSRWSAGALCTAFFVVDLTFFGANVTKVAHGAWFPLAIGAVAYAILSTWRKGRQLLEEEVEGEAPTMGQFTRILETEDVHRVEGTAVFLTGDPFHVPTALLQNLRHNRVVHSRVLLLTVVTEEVPRVPREDKVEVHELAYGFFRVVAHYGFMETPNVPHVLAMASERGLELEVEEVSFFLGREHILRARRPRMSAWRERLFSWLSRNALGATAYYRIPSRQVVELGTQVQL